MKIAIRDAEIAIQNGQLERALDLLIPILNVDSEHQVANALVGAILLSIGQDEKAEPLLFTAVTVSNFTDCYSVVNLAAILRKKGEPGLSLRTLFRALSNIENGLGDNSNVALISTGIAESYLAAQNYTEAADWFLNAALRKPDDENLWVKASTLTFPAQAVNHNFAQSVLLKAMELNKNSSIIVHNLGLSLLGTQRVSEAAVLFDEAYRLDGNNVDAMIAAATAYHMLGDAETALFYYSLAHAAQPQNAGLLANYARILSSVGRSDEALRLLTQAQQLAPEDPVVVDAVRLLLPHNSAN